MGSNNIQQFNGGQVNTESDAQYTADVLRTGGALTGGLFPSPTANKMFYQWSTFLAALAQSLANKGYTISDANLASLTAVLANVVTEADLGAALAVVSFASSIAFDASTISPRVGAFQLTLTGNVTPTTLANTTAGQVLIFIVIQDGTGGHTFAWPSSVTGGVVINPTASSITVQAFVVAATGAIVPLVPTPSFITTQNQPSNLLDTVYQNTGTTPRWVNVVVGCPSGAYGEAYTDGNPSPTEWVASCGTVGGSVGGSYTLSFPVLPGNYYKVATQAGSPYVQKWTEWQ